MPGSYASLYYHLIFATKSRVPIIDDELAAPLHQYLGGTVKGVGGCPVLIGGAREHVHILASLPKTMTVADTVRIVKTRSSEWVHAQFPARRKFGWQDGYGAFTVGVEGIETVRAYIEGQREHHKTVGFREEFRHFLRLHHIEIDERFLL